MMKITKAGFFWKKWVCLCRNTDERTGFYPVNRRGEYEPHGFERSIYYACGRCGRMIEYKTLCVVGVARQFKLSHKDVRRIITDLQAVGRTPLGAGLFTLLNSLEQSSYSLRYRRPHHSRAWLYSRWDRTPKTRIGNAQMDWYSP